MRAPMELLIDERRQLFECLLVTFAPGSQKLGHIAHLRFAPLSVVLVAASRVGHRINSPHSPLARHFFSGYLPVQSALSAYGYQERIPGYRQANTRRKTRELRQATQRRRGSNDCKTL